MLDLPAWIHRAAEFTARCKALPGDVSVEVKIAPPMTSGEAAALASKLPRGLPTPVEWFLIHGSAHCSCQFRWDPYPDRLAVEKQIPFQSIFPSQNCIYGGAHLCDAENFDYYQVGCHDWVSTVEDSEERDLWLRSVPFTGICNGDMLALATSVPKSGFLASSSTQRQAISTRDSRKPVSFGKCSND